MALRFKQVGLMSLRDRAKATAKNIKAIEVKVRKYFML